MGLVSLVARRAAQAGKQWIPIRRRQFLADLGDRSIRLERLFSYIGSGGKIVLLSEIEDIFAEMEKNPEYRTPAEILRPYPKKASPENQTPEYATPVYHS